MEPRANADRCQRKHRKLVLAHGNTRCWNRADQTCRKASAALHGLRCGIQGPGALIVPLLVTAQLNKIQPGAYQTRRGALPLAWCHLVSAARPALRCGARPRQILWNSTWLQVSMTLLQ